MAFLVGGLGARRAGLAAARTGRRRWRVPAFLAAHALIHLVLIIGRPRPSRRVRPHGRSCCRRPSPSIPPSRSQGERSCVVGSRAACCALRSKRYGYDTSYLEMMLNESPAAFFKFAPSMKASAPSRGGPGRRQFRGQDRRRPGGGLRSLHATVRRYGAGSRHAEGPDRGGAAPRSARDERRDHARLPVCRRGGAPIRRRRGRISRRRSRPMGPERRDRS